MQISSDEARALAFIGALIGLTLLGRWVDRPRELGLDQPAVDVLELAARSEALQEGGRRATGAKEPGREGPTVRAPVAPAGRTQAPKGGGKAGGQPPKGGGSAAAPVSLNTATAAELERLPGVGPALAGRIVAYRDSVRGFRSVAELDSVKGIGPALLERLKPLIRLGK